MDQQELSDFILRVLRATAFDHCDEIWWRTDGEYAPVTFLAKCNDLFYWGGADCERITQQNVHLLERAKEDLTAVAIKGHRKGYAATLYAVDLFCCRVRGMRPQGCCYPREREAWPIFDACGPPREVGPGNPYSPEGYLRRQEGAR